MHDPNFNREDCNRYLRKIFTEIERCKVQICRSAKKSQLTGRMELILNGKEITVEEAFFIAALLLEAPISMPRMYYHPPDLIKELVFEVEGFLLGIPEAKKIRRPASVSRWLEK